MNVLWLFPEKKRCGISIYSHDYIQQLEKKCTIISEDSLSWIKNRKCISEKIDKADIVHIQYETSFFFEKGKDFFEQFIYRINKPVIVSLHEVYDEFPDVYSRKNIRGTGLLVAAKRIVYDLRHPLQTAFNKHCKINFRADLILVHQFYHKKILIDKGIKKEKIEVLGYPVKRSQNSESSILNKKQMLRLGSTGFINPGYDYNLLFLSLEKLTVNWKFIWIGGLRNEEQKDCLNDIKRKIDQRNWCEKFIITGWVSDQKQNDLLAEIDIFLALFKHRSSSGTIFRAIGALKSIVASNIQLTKELAESCPLLICENNPESVIGCINSLSSDTLFKEKLLSDVSDYAQKNDLATRASQIISIYERYCK